MCQITGLIVAAGYSSRMGAFKPLLPIGDKTAIETAIDSLQAAGIKNICVVVGHRATELYPLLQRLPVTIVENPVYDAGMFSSVVAGLTSFAGKADACLLLPGDTPLIRKRSIKDLLHTFRKTRAAVCYPVFNGLRGHPPLIDRQCFAAILASDGTGGVRQVLDQFAAASAEVAVTDQGILLDMDTPEDYQQLCQFYAKRCIPSYDECLALLHKQQGEQVARHSQAVASIACRLAGLLNTAGLQLNLELVTAGGLLHDLAKGKPNHPKRGERLVKSKGFPALAGIVASHMDLKVTPEQVMDETAVVFLADKLVQGDKPVPLRERFDYSQKKFSGNPEILSAILRRQQTAELLWNKVSSLVGMGCLEETVFH